jgi:hypothetical protein
VNEIKISEQAAFNLQSLLESRLLIQANSGGGKSYVIRKLLEETHGKVQQIVIDLEGEFAYPLIALGMDRQGCQDYIAKQGQPVPPPSNCMLCPFMSEIELLWLNLNYPEAFADWVRIEQNKIDKYRRLGLADDKNLGVWGRKLLPQKLAEAQKQYAHMTREQINEYKMSHGHCVKSRY